MIFTIIVVGLFVFKAPDYAWLSVPICFFYLVLKHTIKDRIASDRKDKHDDVPYTEYDEFDWWQDNQGL